MWPTGKNKELTEFEKFDRVMTGLVAVSYKELQAELAENRKKKARKNRATHHTTDADDAPLLLRLRAAT
jgi:hypothetical protein